MLEEGRSELPSETPEPDERVQEASVPRGARPARPWAAPDEERAREREREAWEARARREREREREREEQQKRARIIAGVAQAVALLIGVVYVAVGSIALSRGGFDELNSATSVLGLGHTPLLGLLELTFGALLILAASLRVLGRVPMIVLGVLVLIWGIALAISPVTFESALGIGAANGWVYIATGIITLVVAFFSPPQERLMETS